MTLDDGVGARPAVADRLAVLDDRWRAVAPELRRIEARRWLFVGGGGLLIVVGVGVLVAGLGAFVGVVDSGYPWIVHVAVGPLLISLGRNMFGNPASRAGDLIRSRIAGCLGLSYRRDAGRFPIDSFERNDLLPKHSERWLEDLVFGEVLGVPLIFCDATLLQSRGRDRDPVQVFRGPLVISRFPKRARGRTLVVPDGGAIGNFFWGLCDEDRRRVKLESPDFERAFAVYSTDQVEARYLLTPTVMERLLALERRFPGLMTVAFDGHEFLLALDDRRDWFPDPGPFRRLTDPALVREPLEELARLAEIVEILRLNLDSLA